MIGWSNPRCLQYDVEKWTFLSCDKTGSILFWNTASPDPIFGFNPHKREVNHMIFCPKTRHLYSVGKDQKLKIHKIPWTWVRAQTLNF